MYRTLLAVAITIVVLYVAFAVFLDIFFNPVSSLLPEKAVSEITASPDGSKKVCVVRRGYVSEKRGSEHEGYEFILLAEYSDGRKYERFLKRSPVGSEKKEQEELRNEAYSLKWNSNYELTYTHSKGRSGVAYCFNNDLAVTSAPLYMDRRAWPIGQGIASIINRRPILKNNISSYEYVYVKSDSSRSRGLEQKEFAYEEKDIAVVVLPKDRDLVIEKENVIVVLGSLDNPVVNHIISLGPVIVLGFADVQSIVSNQWVYYGKQTDPQQTRLISADQIYLSRTSSELIPDLDLRCKGLSDDYKGWPWPKIHTKNPPIIVPDEEDFTIP